MMIEPGSLTDFNDLHRMVALRENSNAAGLEAVRAVVMAAEYPEPDAIEENLSRPSEKRAPDFDHPPIDAYTDEIDRPPVEAYSDQKINSLANVQPEIDYPVAALGDLLGSAATAIANVVQLPVAVAAQSVLAASAMVAQQFANVELDGRVYPLSLFIITVLESGGRKSSADKVATDPLYRWQRSLADKYRNEMLQYQNELDSYKAQRMSIAKNQKRNQSDIEGDLSEMSSPKQPIKPYVFSQDPSIEGIHKGFIGGYPSQGLFTDEGGQFFGGYAMNKDNAIKTISGLSKIWDGAPIFRLRAGDGESAVLFNRRLTIHLMVQPIVADLVLSDPMLQQQGILARFQMAAPRSMAGERPYNNKNTADSPDILAYQSRLREMLDTHPAISEDGGLELSAMQLDDAAKALWISCYNEIELAQKPGGKLERIRATASKMAENIVRIAGVLTVVNGEAQVSAKQMAGAIQLGQFYLSEQLRLAQRSEINRDAQVAQELVDWIKARGGNVSIDELGKSGPRSVRRSVDRIREVMGSLVVNGLCEVIKLNAHHQPSSWRLVDV